MRHPRCELCNLDFISARNIFGMKIASPLTITPSTTLSSSRILKNGNAELGTRSLSSGHDNDDDCEQRPRIMNVNAFDNFPDPRLLEVKNATEKDASLQSVTELILNGWPEDKDRVLFHNAQNVSLEFLSFES
jgi:hypothetical protein